MTRKQRVALSARSQRVLTKLRDEGPYDRAITPELASVAGGTVRSLYDALVTLRGRYLVRWDQGGANLRITQRGRDLLNAPYYRGRV